MNPCDIVGKGDMMVSLSNGSTLKLKNVRHVLKLKRNLISVGQLTNERMKTTFDGDVCKIKKGTTVMAHGGRYPLHDIRFRGINFSCLIRVGYRSVASETWAYEREGNEGYALQR